MLYQHRPAAQIRTTLAVYFLVGAAMSVVGLWVGGDLTWRQVVVAAVMVPVLVAGVAVLRRLLPGRLVRPAVLLLSGASAVVLLARSL